MLLIDKPRTIVPVRINKVHPITGCTYFSIGYAVTLSILFVSDPSCRVRHHVFFRELNALDNSEILYFDGISNDVHTVRMVFTHGPVYRFLKYVYKSYLYRQPERRNKASLRSFLYAQVSLSSI